MSTDNSSPVAVNNICLDFGFKAYSFQDSFNRFLAGNNRQLGLDSTTDMAAGFIERIWPDGLPGSMIVSHGSFDNFDRYLIRPPVDGPVSHTFAADGVTVCFGVYRYRDKLIADSFYEVPHVPPRDFESYVTGPVHINPESALMAVGDFASLAKIKRQRNQIAGELKRWTECLNWQKELVFIGQDAFRYVGYQTGDDGLVRFLARAGNGLARVARNNRTIMLAAPLTDSASPDTWQPSAKSRPGFTRLGEVTQVKKVKNGRIPERFNLPETITEKQDFAVITIKPQFDSKQMEGITDRIIPAEGFLVTSVGGDIKPITSAQRAISRLQGGNSSNCYLPDFCFNITNASKPPVIEDHFQNSNLPFNLNNDQRESVNKILSAPDMALLQGPPGTGKTTVIEVVALLETLQGKRVLISSQTNIAIDNVLARLSNDPAIRVLRIGAVNRIEPETRIFLEDEAPKTWLKAVRRECLRKAGENAKLNSRIKDALHALDKLEGTARNCEKANRQLLRLQKSIDSLNDGKNPVLSEHKNLLSGLGQLKRQKDVLGELANWFSSPGNSLPQIELIDEAQILSIAEKTASRITQILDSQNVSIIPVGNTDPVNNISILYQVHNAVEAAEELSGLLNQAEPLCSMNDNANDIEQWSRLCLHMEKCLNVIFNKNIPGQAEELIASLKPGTRWLAAVSQLKEICSLLTYQCKDIISNTFIKLKIHAEHCLSGYDERTEKIRKKILSQREKLEDINFRINDLEYEAESLNSQLEEYRSVWQKYWPAACPDLAEPNEIPSDINLNTFRDRSRQFRNWHNELRDQLKRQDTWDSIRKDWIAKLADPAYSDDSGLKQSYKKHANVTGLTCLEAGQKSFCQDENFRPFDTVIIDEVSKATPPELLMPMMCGRKIVLVGDHRQLPPMCRENERSFTEALEEGIIKKEDFEKHRQLITSSFFERLFYEADDTIKHSLSVQYRMNPQIMACVNQCYDGRLIQAEGTGNPGKTRQHGLSIKDTCGGWLLQPHQHVLWIDSTRNQHGKFITEQQIRSSKINLMEIEMIVSSLQMLNRAVRGQGYGPQRTMQVSANGKGVRLADWLKTTSPEMQQKAMNEIFSRGQIKVNGHPESQDYILKENDTINANLRMATGVISFYGAQLGYLRRKIAHVMATKKGSMDCLDIRTNTVDKFQGMEMPVIIVSMVRATHNRHAGEFVKEYRRINVAFSRAQNLLIIVGSERFFRNALVDLPDMNTGNISQVPLYKNIYDIITRFGGRRYAKQVLN